MKTIEMPINCAERNSAVIFEIARSHGRPDVFSLPEGSDVTVELYGGAVVLRLEGELRRVHITPSCG